MTINLLDLFVKIGVKDEASEEVSKISGNLGEGLKKAAGIGIKTVGAASKVIADFVGGAVKSFADYEQLVGGVETLFKDSADQVMQFAERAYETAGLSANQYMETVTSFSASLINSFKDTSSTVTAEMADDMIASLDRQVDAFSEATDAQIELINKQYTENLKLIDEEEYRRVKAIDDEIAALEAEEKAEEEAIKKRQQEEHIAELERRYAAATTGEKRKAIEEELSRYLRDIEEQEVKQARKDEIEKLKIQKNAIKDELDAKREALKEQQDLELESYKKTRDQELQYLKESLKKQKQVIKDSIGTMTEESTLPATAYAEAAKMADQAIVDMADNANKMGSSLESLQVAYSGFSKQNFTMLDNLKLGYGGTKSEMERLIADAAKLSDTVDAQSLSFANIVEAIHVVQTEMGITGTTAKEASSTIAGSVASMKAAWGNLVTAVADDNADFQKAINAFTSSVGTVAQNVLPRVRIALEGAGQLINELFPIIMDEIPVIIEDYLPLFMDSAAGLIESMIEGISSNQESLFSTIISVLSTLISRAATMLPELLKLGASLLISIANGITQALPELADTAVAVVRELTTMLTDKDQLDKFLDAALEMIIALAEALVEVTPELIEAIGTVVTVLCEYLLEPSNIAKIAAAAVSIIVALGRGLLESVGELFENIGELCATIAEKIKENDWLQVGIDIVTGIWDGLKEAWSDLGEWFTDSINKLVGGVKDLFNWGDESADGSHAGGLSYVPRNGYKAVLHEGEMILTESQATAYRAGQRGADIGYTVQEPTPVEVTMKLGEATFGKLIFDVYNQQQYINGYSAVGGY